MLSNNQGTRPEIKTILDIFHNEKVRMLSHGRYFFITLFLNFLFFWVLPKILYPVYLYLPHGNYSLLYFGGIIATILFTIITSNGFFSAVYSLELPIFENFRINQEPWPWVSDPETHSKNVRSICRNLVVQYFIVIPAGLAMFYYAFDLKYITDPELFPSASEIIGFCAFFDIVDDTVFYWTHRVFHTPWFYKRFHKQHHEYSITVAVATLYNHPIEFLIQVFVGFTLGHVILSRYCHIFTVYMWHLYIFPTGFEDHCGYDLPWSIFAIPFGQM